MNRSTITTKRRPWRSLWLGIALGLTGCTGSTDVEPPATDTGQDVDVPCTNVVDRLEGDDLDTPSGVLDFSAAEVLAALDTTAVGVLTPGPDQTPSEPHDLVVTLVPTEPVVHLSETPPPSDPDQECAVDRYVLEASITVEAFETTADTGLPNGEPALRLTSTVELTAEAADRILLTGSAPAETDWMAQEPSDLAIDSTVALQGEWAGSLRWVETNETLGEWTASPL